MPRIRNNMIIFDKAFKPNCYDWNCAMNFKLLWPKGIEKLHTKKKQKTKDLLPGILIREGEWMCVGVKMLKNVLLLLIDYYGNRKFRFGFSNSHIVFFSVFF